MIWQDTFEKYIGQWQDNFQNGIGIHIWYECKGEQKYLRNRYVGEWKNGFRHGYGVFFYANGGKYEGMWEQNYKNGYGIFTFHDGSQFSGKFNLDRMDYNNIGYLPAENIHKISHLNNPSITSKGTAHQKLLSKGKEVKVIQDDEEDEALHAKKTNFKEIKEKNEEKENNEIKKKLTALQTIEQKNNIPDQIQNQNIGMKKSGVTQDKSQDPKQKTTEKLTDNNKFSNKKTGEIQKIDEKLEANQTKGKQSDGIKSEQKEGTSKITSKKTSDQIDLNSIKNNNASPGIIQENSKQIEPDKKSHGESKTVFTNKTVKESEQNPFRTLLDITDIIETEPEMENCLKDVENTLLRYLYLRFC